MTEENVNESEVVENETQTEAPQESQSFTPPATQEELDRIIESRLARDRKSRYDELNTKIAELEASKQELAAKAAEGDSAVQAARLDATRFRIAMQHGITDEEDIELFLTGTDEDTLTKQAQRLAENKRTPASPVGVTLSPGSAGSAAPAKSADAIAREFFGV